MCLKIGGCDGQDEGESKTSEGSKHDDNKKLGTRERTLITNSLKSIHPSSAQKRILLVASQNHTGDGLARPGICLPHCDGIDIRFLWLEREHHTPTFLDGLK